MINLEELKLYLPKYLSTESEKNLFENLKDFPYNIDSRIYSNINLNESTILQGDGLEGLLVINLPDKTINETKAMVLSNTCDVYENNERIYPSSICYTPIINLDKFLNKLEIKKIASPQKIFQFVDSLKKQKISQIFFLPKSGKLQNDSFIFFDKINSCDNNRIPRNRLIQNKIFTLSNYGFYLFIFKLSIHFSRIREGLDRDIPLQQR